MWEKQVVRPIDLAVVRAKYLLATLLGLGSLCACFICSIRLSAPRKSLWHKGQVTAFWFPPRMDACALGELCGLPSWDISLNKHKNSINFMQINNNYGFLEALGSCIFFYGKRGFSLSYFRCINYKVQGCLSQGYYRIIDCFLLHFALHCPFSRQTRDQDFLLWFWDRKEKYSFYFYARVLNLKCSPVLWHFPSHIRGSHGSGKSGKYP